MNTINMGTINPSFLKTNLPFWEVKLTSEAFLENSTILNYAMLNYSLKRLNSSYRICFFEWLSSLKAVKSGRKTRKVLRWIQRLGTILGIVVFFTGFARVPSAFASQVILGQVVSTSSLFLNKLVEKTKEKTLPNENGKETNPLLSKKFLMLGSFVTLVAIGSILYHRESISRFLFNPPMENIELLYKYTPVCYTLEEREIMNTLNFRGNILTRKAMIESIMDDFGNQRMAELMEGNFPIHLHQKDVFTVLVRLADQLAKATGYYNYLEIQKEGAYKNYLDPHLLVVLRGLRGMLRTGLEETIGSNPKELNYFAQYMYEVLDHVEQKHHIDFTPTIQKEVVDWLIAKSISQMGQK